MRIVEKFRVSEKNWNSEKIKNYLKTQNLESYNFSEGFGIVEREDGKFNYIKSGGTFISEKWFDYCCMFKDGFGIVKIGGTWYGIDKDGKLHKFEA